MDKVINRLPCLCSKIKYERYVFHNDKRQARGKVNVQHFTNAPSDEIAINSNISILAKNLFLHEPLLKRQRVALCFS